jgi:hypothetical protein
MLELRPAMRTRLTPREARELTNMLEGQATNIEDTGRFI